MLAITVISITICQEIIYYTNHIVVSKHHIHLSTQHQHRKNQIILFSCRGLQSIYARMQYKNQFVCWMLNIYL